MKLYMYNSVQGYHEVKSKEDLRGMKGYCRRESGSFL